MARKGENIYKRKDGRWEGRYKKGRKKNGQLKYGYIYGQTYADVKYRLYTYKLHYHALIQQQGESGFSYEEWTIIWLSQQQSTVKVSTYTTYLYKLKKYILPSIGNCPLNQLTHETVQNLVNSWLQYGLKASTIHVLYQLVKKTLKDATEQSYLKQTPCTRIRLPKKRQVRVRAMTKKEQHVLESCAKGLPLYRGLSVLLALNTGLRIGEIAALRWTDIDLKQRMIHITQTFQRVSLEGGIKKTQLLMDSSKTESSNRVIPISTTLYKYLKKWKKKAPGSYVCSNSELPSEPRLLTYYFHKIRKQCGFEHLHFHQLRHTFATRCIETNSDIVSLSRLLGHTSTKTTLDIYADSMVESRIKVITNMSKALQ
ncbi:hypothetical protein IGJ55_003113 [Enterococcus sp. AZ170]|uniref:tyrosine-type recombinase/integrase n=1 Tax=unclassified Enterococcus TaxID=2608891 RepID=UPI003D272DA3